MTPAFCPWYPLSDAALHAPRSPGVFQLRLPEGLLEYPLGKSAMVHYEGARCLFSSILQYLENNPNNLLCRHLVIDGDSDPQGMYESVLERFTRRFGAAPNPNPKR